MSDHSPNDSFLELDHISKFFPGVRALEDVTLSIQKGEIHSIVGENGAGKSTLMKVLAGVYPYGDYEGRILVEDHECQFGSILDAETLGVVMIPQELAIVKELSIAENMFLNVWPGSLGFISWDDLRQQASEMIESLGIDVDPDTPIREVSAAKQQLTLIAKALSKSVRILILDEPTSSLTEAEIDVLFDRLRLLKERGITSIFISHKIEEVMKISDRVTVLRDGQKVATEKQTDLKSEDIVRMMVGRSISQMYPREERTPGEVMLEVRGLTLYDPIVPDSVVVKDASFEVRSGEILGLSGLMGAGRSELLTGIFGAWSGRVEGDILIRGQNVTISSPQDAMNYGLGLLTEDRKRFGLIEGKSVRVNITLASLERVSNWWSLINSDDDMERSEEFVRSLNIRTPSVEALIEYLSGGNQQKVIVGRWLSAESKILLLDDPTRGIDVGAKVEVFHLLNKLAAEGSAIVFVSSELPELLGVADRILAMYEGELRADVPWREATQESIMYYATGHR
jgi:D-xylose transport system ATP-binding protein